MNPRDTRVVVTGAAGGIGRALAARAAAEGARVVVSDIDADRLRTTAADLGAHAVVADLATADGVTALVEESTAHLGGIDMWIGNAGIQGGLGLDTPDATWHLAHEINVMAHVRAARLLVPRWLERGGDHRGRFVVTASAAGLLTMLGSAPYSVTKHGAVAFAEWLAATYGHHGIDVHVLAPQGVETDIYHAAGPAQGLLRADGLLQPEDVADALFDAVEEGRMLVLPHPRVADYYRARAGNPDAWVRGMQRLQRRLDDATAELSASDTGTPAPSTSGADVPKTAVRGGATPATPAPDTPVREIANGATAPTGPRPHPEEQR
ncbi:putative oxidoreductase [Mobilicoccus pelagius NBRC 104925]|uniref:Putative oxidoreductase n=1 Tax=Mobilicoccus pelagius NBRC 104925 TaxID=1089455 RepID=H5UU77_9MICO|nr:putative oxidoreductase [Mobilicoccus pelagius NBRC 104925]